MPVAIGWVELQTGSIMFSMLPLMMLGPLLMRLTPNQLELHLLRVQLLPCSSGWLDATWTGGSTWIGTQHDMCIQSTLHCPAVMKRKRGRGIVVRYVVTWWGDVSWVLASEPKCKFLRYAHIVYTAMTCSVDGWILVPINPCTNS